MDAPIAYMGCTADEYESSILSLSTNFKLNTMSTIIKEDLIVESSAIQYATYYNRSKKLFVMFSNAHCYEYQDVDPHVWEGLRASPSAGAFINRVIKKYHFNKIV